MKLPTMADQRSVWFNAFVLISLILCAVTFFGVLLPRPFSYFNLRNENNFAALFSGLLLLMIALHTYDGWSGNRASKPTVAYAWLILAIVLTALSLDEIGSLHERVLWIYAILVEGTVDLSSVQAISETQRRSIYWWSLVPFGVLLAGAVAYATSVLWRSIEDKKSVVLICVAFLLFASIGVQEYVERTLDWSSSRFLRAVDMTFRPLLEEGTELLGMLILLKVAMGNTRGVLSAGERSDAPVFEAVVRLRSAILSIGLVAAPLIAYGMTVFPEEQHDNGAPADWTAAALFAFGAIAAARPYFVGGYRLDRFRWSLVLLGFVGCGSTILQPEAPAALPLTAIVASAAFLIWFLSPSYVSSTYQPAGVILAVLFAAALYVGQNDFIVYTLIQYTALAFYWVNSARSSFELSAENSPLQPGHPIPL